MRIVLAAVTTRRRLKSKAAQELIDDYLQRCRRYAQVDYVSFPNTEALLRDTLSSSGRTGNYLMLLDSEGKTMTSSAFAERLQRLQDDGQQQVTLAIGPADGWSSSVKERCSLQLSFGPITLPHELALVVLAEQVYRSLSFSAGHPYHSSH